MSQRIVRSLAASFVVIVTPSCTPKAKTNEAGALTHTTRSETKSGYTQYPSHLSRNVRTDDAGHPTRVTCNYMETGSCPSAESGGTCNPPGPLVVVCPPDKDAGIELDPNEPAPPANRSQWLRVKPRLSVSEWGCHFTPSFYCPEAGTTAPCDVVKSLTLSCQRGDGSKGPKLDGGVMPKAPEGQSSWFYIEGFSYTDAWGKCRQVKARWCDPKRCDVDEGSACDGKAN